MNFSHYSKQIVHYLKNCKTARNSTVFKGKTYEHAVKRELAFKLLPFCDKKTLNLADTHFETSHTHLLKGYDKDDTQSPRNFSLLVNYYNENMKVVGQCFDKGVDIVGSLDSRIVVIVQCKNYTTKKITGREIRECVGITSLYKTTNFQQESLTIIASPSGITKDAIEDMNKFPLNLLYVQVSHLHVPMDLKLQSTEDAQNLMTKLSESGQLIGFVENKKCYKAFGFAKNVLL